MTIKIPTFQEPGLTKYLVDLNKQHDLEIAGFLSKSTANHSILLQSPGAVIWEVTVNDAGSLVITKVQG